MSLLPSRLHVSSSPDEPKLLDIDGDEAAEAFDVLGSETARSILATIYDDPKPPTEIRAVVGTSLQNVHYHVERLEEAGLIEPVGSGYSSKGNEMTVYGPASEAVVVFAGVDEDGARLYDLLKQLFGLFVVVGASTLVFALLHERLVGTDPAYESAATEAETPTATDAPEVADTAATAALSLDPTTAFLLGGCAVAIVVWLWWAVRPRLRSS